MWPHALGAALALLAFAHVTADKAPDVCSYPTVMKELGTLRRGEHKIAMEYPVRWIKRMIPIGARVNKRCKYDNSYGIMSPNVIYFNHGCKGMFKLCLDKSQPVRCVQKSFRRIRNPKATRLNQYTFSNKILSVHHTGFSRHCFGKNETARFSFKDNFFKIDDKKCHGNFKICLDPRKKYKVERKANEKQCFHYQGTGESGMKRFYGYTKVKVFGKSSKCKLNEDYGNTKSYAYVNKQCRNKFEICADQDTVISGNVRQAKKDASYRAAYADCIIYKPDGLADSGVQRFPHFDVVKLMKSSESCKEGSITSADYGIYVKKDKKNAVFVKDACFDLEFLICRTNASDEAETKDSDAKDVNSSEEKEKKVTKRQKKSKETKRKKGLKKGKRVNKAKQ